MGSYYYLKDKDSELGYSPVPEDEYIEAIFRIAKKNGVKITDKMLLEEIKRRMQKHTAKRRGR